ncbi:hypothetical protein RsoM2USA_484 [Ralstonia phage RsoM2USA]|nr:hypothetical protein RsoM2USA_484 [Ralstonia phage RsoM2USA]
MSKILVKFSDNYADEFDVDGFMVIDKDQFNKEVALIKRMFDEYGEREFYFGTNESFNYGDFDEWFSVFTVTDITDSEADVLSKLFANSWSNRVEFGTMNAYEYALDSAYDEFGCEEYDVQDEEDEE